MAKAEGMTMARRRYNHLYALGFSVDSDQQESATAVEILVAIAARLAELLETGEVLEAVGISDETIDNATGRTVESE
jgi:hypothetical protein